MDWSPGMISNGSDPGMIFKILAILIAALSGSLHCGAMCGGLSLVAGRKSREQMVYQGSRLLSYLGIGALAGGLGALVFSVEVWSLFAVLGGWLVSSFLVYSGWRLWFHGSTPELRFRYGLGRISVLFNRISRERPQLRPALFGFLTPLLPCGLLSTALALSAASGSAIQGLLIFGAVWMGSLPALLLATGLPNWLQASRSLALRRGIAALILVAGMASLHQRLGSPLATDRAPGRMSGGSVLICH